MRRMLSSRRGFSLLELAVVLTILGLIVGGVMTGSAIIRGAEINAVASESRKYITAFGQFRDKYSALPGDLSTASSYWSSVSGGTGNGRVQNNDNSSVANANEISLFWIHLVNAGMAEGNFTAFANITASPITNVPGSKMKGAAWNVAYLGTVGVDSDGVTVTGTNQPSADIYFDGTYEHVLLFGGGTSALLPTGVVDPSEAFNIDTKLDDGKPASGDVTSLESQGGATCSDLAASATTSRAAAVYSLSNTSKSACSLIFRTGY